MKNIVMIHLESLHNAFLYQDSELFPNIMRLKEKSLFFSNHYSTATSTIMTISDLIYGSCRSSEKSQNLEHFVIDHQYTPWNIQFSKKVLIYPVLDWKFDFINIGKIMQKNVRIVQKKKYRDFQENIADTIREMENECIYIYDWSSLYMRHNCERNYRSWIEYYANQYQQIDVTVGFVLEQIEKYNKLDDTLIVVFGDHGDDMYSYGKNKGFTHAIAPYPNVIRTPLMLYHNKIKKQINRDLVCTLDIGLIIKNIFSGESPKFNRKYVFSRNLFPLQKEGVLKKSYSVTDGNYLLLVSSQGLELYICRFMSQSIFNLLNWCVLKRDGSLALQKNKSMHFQRMIQEQSEDMEEHFYRLRKYLYREIREIVGRGLLKDNVKRWFAKIHYNLKNER